MCAILKESSNVMSCSLLTIFSHQIHMYVDGCLEDTDRRPRKTQTLKMLSIYQLRRIVLLYLMGKKLKELKTITGTGSSLLIN